MRTDIEFLAATSSDVHINSYNDSQLEPEIDSMLKRRYIFNSEKQRKVEEFGVANFGWSGQSSPSIK